METGSYVRGDLAILEAGFAALEQAVLVHDSEGKIVACNPAAAKLAGKPVDEILGQGAGAYEVEARFKDGTPLTRENSRLLRCIRTGDPARDVLVEIRDDSASTRWVRVSHQPLIREGEDRPWGAVSSIVPVTDPTPYETLNDFTRQLQCLLEAGEALLYLKDLDGRYTFMNRRLGALLGMSRDDATGKTDREILPAELADAAAQSDRRALDSRSAVLVEERFGAPEMPLVRTVKFPLLDDASEPYALAGVSLDVSALESTKRELEMQLDGAPGALLAIDREGRVSFANRDAHALGAQCDDLQLAIDGRERLADLLDQGDVTVQAAIEAGQRLSLTRELERPDGEELWLAIEVVPLDAGSGAMCSLRDVTEERLREEELSHLAFHDSLTGLPNRRFTEEQLELGLARARRHRGGLGVVFLDIDEFKRVNEELGHSVGDEVLIEFGERLGGALRESDAVGRMAEGGSVVARRGGDEFVLVLTDLSQDCGEQIATVLERVEGALAAPFVVGGNRLKIAASVGAAAYPLDGRDSRMLLELANAAMRQVKQRRRRARLSEPPEAG